MKNKMKNKKIIYIISLIVVLGIVIVSVCLIKKNNEQDAFLKEPTSLIEQLLENDKNKKYYKLSDTGLINEDTFFNKYAFITDNKIYIFNPNKLDYGTFEYKKVYDNPSRIRIMNIVPTSGADIMFYDYNDTRYTLHDNNIDNKVSDSYDTYLKANYNLSDYLIKWDYSTEFLGKKIDYDFMSNYVYSKDNILYSINYLNEKYPTIEKISGNYEGQKVIRIYNERILKTDKGFYEIMSYFDNNLNKTVTTTVKISLLTKYYDEVLTFTYKYVILKDYTLIPINDVMTNRVREYQDDYFLSGFNYMSEIRYEE